MGDAAVRGAVPAHRQPSGLPTVGSVVSIDLVDWAGGAASLMPEGYRYALVAVDKGPGSYVTAVPLGGRDSASILAAFDKVVEHYSSHGRKIQFVKADSEFGRGSAVEEAAKVYQGLRDRGLQVDSSSEHASTRREGTGIVISV